MLQVSLTHKTRKRPDARKGLWLIDFTDNPDVDWRLIKDVKKVELIYFQVEKWSHDEGLRTLMNLHVHDCQILC